MGERGRNSVRGKNGGRGKRSSHSGGNKLFENKGKAVLAVQSHFLAVCVFWRFKTEIIIKRKGGRRGEGKRQKEEREGTGGFVGSAPALLGAWRGALASGPRTGAREERAFWRGREWERRLPGVALYLWLFFFSVLEHSEWAGHQATVKQRISIWLCIEETTTQAFKKTLPECLSIVSSGWCYWRRHGRAFPLICYGSCVLGMGDGGQEEKRVVPMSW